MKKLFAVMMALGLVGFMACSSPSAEHEAEATDESSAVMDEMESSTEATSDEMAEEATSEEGTAEEVEDEAAEEAAPEAE